VQAKQPKDLSPKLFLPPAWLELMPSTEKAIMNTLLSSDNNQQGIDTITSSIMNKLLICGVLRINLEQGIISYSDKTPVEISSDTKIIKFLVFLMQNKRVVEYREIAKNIEMNCWHEGISNEDVAREVQFIKRDLTTFLEDKVGMNQKEIQNLIIVKKNVGYKLRCEADSLKTH